MNLFVCAIAVAVAISGSKNEGVLKGHVGIGPLTPVMRKGHEGPQPTPEMYKHYMVSIAQFPDEAGPVRPHFLRLVKKLHLSKKGNFMIRLHPGQYRVEVVRDTPQVVGSLPSQTVQIEAGKTLHVELNVDTGIR